MNPIYLPFNRSLADLSPEAAVQEILIHQLQVQGVVVGVNFRFGSKQRGHTDQLQSLKRSRCSLGDRHEG